ncbi:MAG: chromosome segregation protein SMC [Clostridia bacterium]|nr:chromosome segregation protein SMC [Clostridia bacterium]
MYLKTLELYGFKSFPDKTVISFGPGMTAIVGANGSGKSNLSDAIRFVLGEMSAKTLRGNKMEDVIFGGTATRKSANFAEVTMTIDNADHRLKYDGDEVSVTRRLYRDGSSEYKLNGEACRLKDVVETFLDTGIGREGYSVIGQGKISEILSSKGSDRRDVFEEAAGISKFRYRKTEAQNKLAGVTENSVRIGDILAEVEDRMPTLEEQAKKAERYRALSEERRALEIAIFCEQLGEGEAEAEALQAELEVQNTAYREVFDRCEVIERELEKLYLETQQENVEAERLRTLIVEAATDQGELASTLSVLENDIHHHEERIREAEESIRELTADSEAVRDEWEAARAAAEEALRESREKDRALSELRHSLTERETAAAVAEARLKELGETVESLENEVHKRELAAREMSVMKQANEARIASEEEKLEHEEDRKKTLVLAARAAERTCEEKRAEVAACEERLSSVRAELDRLGRTAITIERRIAALTESRAVCEEKKNALTRLARAFEGYPESVRAVMQASASGKLSGICGPVSSLFSTEEAYTTALETALGAAAGHIVVETRDAAKAAIAYLKRERLGRATFLPLDTVEHRVDDMNDVTARGFVDSALNLAKFDPHYTRVAEYLLGRCAVAEDLESATAIARGRDFKLKTVTLDGQIIHSGGAFAGGQKAESARLLTREKDLAALSEEIRALTASVEEARREADEITRSENALAQENSTLRSALEAANTALFDASGALALCRERVASCDETMEAIRAEIRRLSGEGEAELLAEAAEQKAALEARLKETAELRAQTAEELSGIREAMRAERAEADELSALCARLVAESTAKSAAFESISSAEGARNAARENLQSQITSLQAAIAEAQEKIKAAMSRKDEANREGTLRGEKLESIKRHLDEMEQKSVALRTEQKDSITRRESLLADIQVKASRLERMNAERSAYLARLAEEYELDEAAVRAIKIEPGTAKALGGKARLSKIRSEIRALGPVNEGAPEEFKELSERQAFLRTQYDDVTASKEGLENLIVSLEKTMREMFLSTFENLRKIFQEIFREFFGGGNADIILTDREDLLNCFIEITVQPPGKNVKNLSLLSGGEQAFVAIALYLSLLRVNPTPFCIFDEIESALDESNVARFAEYLHRQSKSTQFLLISHRRGTMERADVLYGITMQEKGVSDFIRLAEDEILDEYEQN